jgi:hypothetical protein
VLGSASAIINISQIQITLLEALVYLNEFLSLNITCRYGYFKVLMYDIPLFLDLSESSKRSASGEVTY